MLVDPARRWCFPAAALAAVLRCPFGVGVAVALVVVAAVVVVVGPELAGSAAAAAMLSERRLVTASDCYMTTEIKVSLVLEGARRSETEWGVAGQ